MLKNGKVRIQIDVNVELNDFIVNYAKRMNTSKSKAILILITTMRKMIEENQVELVDIQDLIRSQIKK